MSQRAALTKSHAALYIRVIDFSWSRNQRETALLTGIYPMHSGAPLGCPDATGYSDSVLVSDTRLPAERIVGRVIAMPGVIAAKAIDVGSSILQLEEPVAHSRAECRAGRDPVQVAQDIDGRGRSAAPTGSAGSKS